VRLCLAFVWWNQNVQQHELNTEGRTEATAVRRGQKLQTKNPPERKFPQTKGNHWLKVPNVPTNSHNQSTHSCNGQTNLYPYCPTLLLKKTKKTNEQIKWLYKILPLNSVGIPLWTCKTTARSNTWVSRQPVQIFAAFSRESVESERNGLTFPTYLPPLSSRQTDDSCSSTVQNVGILMPHYCDVADGKSLLKRWHISTRLYGVAILKPLFISR
jgi:hypothetical protein